MNCNFYYRLVVSFVIGAFSCLLLPDAAHGQTTTTTFNQGWQCENCNDNNPCTWDLCFFGNCFNIPLRNCGQNRACDLKIFQAKAGECYIDSEDGKSKVELNVCVWWKHADVTKDIKVSINGQDKFIDIKTSTGDACIKFIVLANGSSNNVASAVFNGDADCKGTKTYHLPQPCTATCDLEITKVQVSQCYYDATLQKSRVKVNVCVKWKSRPANDFIEVKIQGQIKTIQTNTNNGDECVEFVVDANGSQNNGIWAYFKGKPSCQDESKFHCPNPCYEAPQCDLDITKVELSGCYYDHYDYQSKSKLRIYLTWKNKPASEKIIVSISNQTKYIETTIANGSAYVDFIILSNGSQNNGVWAKFSSLYTCSDDAYYHCPQPCYETPQCDLTIKSATLGGCYYDHATYQSKVKLTVCVGWKNRPAGDNIMVSIYGQNKPVTVTTTNGYACVEFIVLSNGSQNNGIWAKFTQHPSCQDESYFHCPQPCYEAPQCDLRIKSAVVGNCYYDHASYQSKVKIKVGVEWKNRPANDPIVVKIADGQIKSFYPGTTSGVTYVDFYTTANGSYNNGIWAYFQNTNYCQDEYFYHCPQPCYEAPQCDLRIKSTYLGDCYYDHATYQSKTKLTVCVEWTNRPANNKIIVKIADGQFTSFTPPTTSGSKCVEFIILSNGSYNNGIWTMFDQATSCQDEGYYHCPQPCYEAPACDLTIKSAVVGDCYYDHTSYQSKSKLTVCVDWKNRPGTESIIVKIADGQTKTVPTTGTNGTACVEFIILSTGVQNNGIWAYFQYKTSCQSEYYYHCRPACYEAPACDLKIKSATVGACYYDHADYKSKVKVTVCIEWKNRPGSERIYIGFGGSVFAYTPNIASGNVCFVFTTIADGSQNNGIWTKFEHTTTCKSDYVYNRPQPCYEAPPCALTIKSAVVGDCYYDHVSYQSKSKLTVCVDWKNRPANDPIVVKIADGQTKSFYPNEASGTACVEFIISSNGSQNNGIWAYFQYKTTCQAEYFYHCRPACYEAPACDLKIKNSYFGSCYYDHASYQSKVKFTVCVEWKNSPANDPITVKIADGQTKSFYPNATNGYACVEFIIVSNGAQNNGIWAYYKYKTTCQAEGYYHCPQPCYEAPACDLKIKNSYFGSCYYDHATYQSKVKFTVCIEWKNRPANDPIVVKIADGQTKSFYPNETSGVACVEFIILSSGAQNNGIWAYFKYKTTCQAEGYYHCPQPCYVAPACDLNIKNSYFGSCYYDNATHQSKVKFTVCVEWKNRPANDPIVVKIGDGQVKSFYPSEASGIACVEFIILSNGSQNNGIWAYFQYKTSCQAEGYYHCPQPCYQAPACNLKITKIEVGNCYYDHTDYTCKSNLKICFQWSGAPAGEKVVLKVGNTLKYIYFNASSGILCFDYTLIANGTQNVEVWAKFETTTSCYDKKWFNAPYACNPGNIVAESGNKPQDANVLSFDVDKTALTTGVEVEDATEQLPSYNLSTTNTNTTATHDLRVFPNPTSEELSVDLTSFAGKKVQLQVFNTIGQVMYQTTIDEVNTDKVQLDVRKYTSDMYFLKVNVSNEGTYTQKFVVKR